jgi:glucokinase
MNLIGLDVGGTNIKAGLVRNGKVIQRGHYPTRARESDRSVVDQIRLAIRDFGDRAAAIGIGIAGIIDSPRGIVRYSPNLGWEDMPLVKTLTKEFHRPVRILNDVNAILYGEWHYGAARGYDDVFLFTLGTGVGGAAICGGKMVFGANGFAGEFGHATINFNGPKCTCGNYGCLESYVGTKFFLRRARYRMRKTPTRLRRYPRLTPKIIGVEAKKGDRLSRELFGEIGYYLGIGISNLLNLFDPALIVISGGIARAGRFLFQPIRRAVKDTDQGARHRRYEIVTGKLGDDAGILGAAHYASLTNSQ